MSGRTAALLLYTACLYVPAAIVASRWLGRRLGRWSAARVNAAVEAALDPRVAHGLELAGDARGVVAEAERITREAAPS